MDQIVQNNNIQCSGIYENILEDFFVVFNLGCKLYDLVAYILRGFYQTAILERQN